MSTDASTDRALVVRAADRLCALRLQDVSETMRPLPVRPMAGAPECVLGVALIRGVATPVIDLEVLLGRPAGAPAATRFVTLSAGGRAYALAVGAVEGVRAFRPDELAALPPILGDARASLVEAIGASDAELLVVLRAQRIVPEAVWTLLASSGESP